MTLIEGKYWFDVSSTTHKEYVEIAVYEKSLTLWRKRPKFKKLESCWYGEGSATFTTVEQRARKVLDEYLEKDLPDSFARGVLAAYGTDKHPIA